MTKAFIPITPEICVLFINRGSRIIETRYYSLDAVVKGISSSVAVEFELSPSIVI